MAGNDGMDWIHKLHDTFFKPAKPGQGTPGLTMQRAAVDTTGMDPEMKDTIVKIRGAMGAGSPSDTTGAGKKVNYGGGS